MGNNYRGSYKKEVSANEWTFDLSALIQWLITLLISFIPLYIELIKYLNTTGEIDRSFWISYFVKGDILWVFSTFLLFVLMDFSIKKRKKEKKWIKILFFAGVLVFIFTEATWIAFNILDIDEEASVWSLYIGIPLIFLSLSISTPLKIEFIKEN